MHRHLRVLGIQAAILCLHASVALARAGGGGGYSSGGSSSSSSFGGSSSSSSGSSSGSGEFGIFDLIVLIVIVGFAIYAQRRMVQERKEMAARRRRAAAEHAETIRAHDAGFDPDALAARVCRAFDAIQHAWSTQDLEPVRGFMSDGLHERFSMQLREQHALGYRNQLSDVRVRECVLVEAQSLAHFDVVSMRITAAATDIRVDATNGAEIPGSRRADRFTEIWSFLRGRGGASGDRGGLFEGRCPNCAAPVDPKRAWDCSSCGSDLDSAPPDWVLVEITQECEWRPRERNEPEWLKAAVTRDSGLTAQALEDRASVLFWRLMDAERTGRVDELASVARSTFLDERRARLGAAGDRYLGDCAVGAVQLRGLLPGQEWDLALVEIRWSGGTYLRRQQGPPESTDRKSLRRSLLVMARRAGSQSQLSRCIVSAHCHRCGAPDTGALDAACTYCGEILNDGSDWLIDRFPSLEEPDARTLLAELGRPPRVAPRGLPAESSHQNASPAAPLGPGGLELFALCAQLVYTDQHFDAREGKHLEGLAKQLGIPESKAKEVRRAAQFGRLEVEGAKDSEQAHAWRGALREMANADGRLTRQERALLAKLGASDPAPRGGFASNR